MNESVEQGQNRRLRLLQALIPEIEKALQATVEHDEQALENSVQMIISQVESLSGTISSGSSIFLDEEVQVAMGVRNSAKKLSRLLERIGKTQRAELRMVSLQGTGGYTR